MKRRRLLGALVCMGSILMTVGCASSRGQASTAQQALTPITLSALSVAQDYRIGALDKLNITVFQVKDLSLEKVQVDASGQIQLPLIGNVVAAGKTTGELSAEIATRLSERYLQSPQVSVVVDEAVSQKVTVDGAVIEPGVYPLKGRTTLLQAIAMAKGATAVADTKKVAIFRTIDGTRSVAVFDLTDIRAGRAEDPEVRGNDVVVVDASGIKSVWRDFLSAAPALLIFRPY